MKNNDEIRHSASEMNSIVQNIFKEVYGEDAPPEEVVPFSFITKRDLVDAADALKNRGMKLRIGKYISDKCIIAGLNRRCR